MVEVYEKLQIKYNLPSAKEIEKEFGFDPKKKSLNEIIENILELFAEYTKLLEALIFIDSSSQPSRLYEASMLREKEIDVFEIYKGLMKLFWQGKTAVLESTDNVKVEFIKNSFKEWKKVKQEFLKIFKIFEKEWSNVVFKKDEHVAYHG